VVDDEKYLIETGDTIVIEPNDRHKVVNNTDKDFIYMAFKVKYPKDDFYQV